MQNTFSRLRAMFAAVVVGLAVVGCGYNTIPTLEEQEIRYIKQVLSEAGGNKSLAAETLGIDRVSLWRKIKRYRLE